MRKSPRFQNIIRFVVAIAFLAIFLGPATVSAQSTQALSEDWRTADFSFASSMMAADLNGNIYVLGDTVVGRYLVIKKFSAAGILLWQTTYDPVDTLGGVWIVVDGNGNAIVQANMVNARTGNPFGWVTLKYDTNGNLLWFKSASGMVAGSVRVGVDVNNNIYVAGSALNDSVLIKYSPSGTTLWTKVFDNNGAFDTPSSMVISPDGSRIGVAGSSGYTLMALMYDTNGNLLWSNTNSNVGPAGDLAFGPGNVSYFGASTNFPYPNPNQMAIVKFDAAGNQIYVKGYSVGDRTYFVRVDGQGNVVATGIETTGYFDWMTIKTDASGNLLWSQRYDGGRNNDEYPLMLVIDASNSVYVTGRGGPNPGSGNVSYLKGVVAKYNSDGTPQWAVWDDYAGGRAIALGAGNTLTSLGYNYLVVAHYTPTGLPDLPPAAPTNLSARADLSLIDLSFVDNASNEFWVDVERCTGSGCTNFSKIGQTLGENATTFRDTNVSRGVTYIYRLRAVGFMGASVYSNTLEVSEAPLNPPAAPSNLTTAMSGASVVLNWLDNSANENEFDIERCQGAGCTNFLFFGVSGVNVATWTDSGIVAGQSYSYRVRALNYDGYSNYSNTATIVTLGGPALPPAPTNLIGQALNKSQIRLTWTNNGANQDGVKIERCLSSNCTNFTQIAIVAGTATTYTDSGLAANTTCRYRVRAHNSAGDSSYSNIASTRTLRR